MTGTTSKIIQSGWFPDLRNASMTFSRLTIFFRFCTDVSPSIWARRSRARHLDAALVADHARELHPLVLAAGALVVLGRTKNSSAEETIAFGFERSIVDGLRLLDFAV